MSGCIARRISLHFSGNASARSSRVGGPGVLALVVAAVGGALLGLIPQSATADQSPVVLPAGAESVRAAELGRQFPGGDATPVLLVISRGDGADLTPDDLAAGQQARERMAGVSGALAGPGPPLIPAADNRAAVAPVLLSPDLTGFALSDTVTGLREAARDGLPDTLVANVTGGPAFGADIANSFAGANINLIAVTGAVVALLLIITYRSPVLWLVPLLVIAFADRIGAVTGAAVAEAAGLGGDGSTSGITSVLVFGAGTNYALLLISRYREELRRQPVHRQALRTAVRFAGPAIVASNATVVLALLCLLLASSPTTRSLGVQAAAGLVVAAIFVLLVLPPLLALFGPRLFWPFIPRVSAEEITTTGVWHRIADWVSGHAGRVTLASTVALGVLATGLIGIPIGLSLIDQFRVRADSVTGFTILAAHFPGGLTDPTRVIARTDAAPAVATAISATPGIASVTSAGVSDTGLSQWQVVLDAAPASDAAFTAVAALRDSVRQVASDAIVGGSDATALDTTNIAVRDRWVVIPATVAVSSVGTMPAVSSVGSMPTVQASKRGAATAASAAPRASASAESTGACTGRVVPSAIFGFSAATSIPQPARNNACGAVVSRCSPAIMVRSSATASVACRLRLATITTAPSTVRTTANVAVARSRSIMAVCS